MESKAAGGGQGIYWLPGKGAGEAGGLASKGRTPSQTKGETEGGQPQKRESMRGGD